MTDLEDLSPPVTTSGAFERQKLKFEHPAEHELNDHAEASLQVGIDSQDGLPRPISGAWEQHLAPALDPDTLLCMEDSSQYVVRDAGGHIVARFAAMEVRSDAQGRTVVSRATALSRLERHGVAALRLAIGAFSGGADVAVEPIRPKCRFYARQLIDFPGEQGHTLMRRFCQALRTEDGEYESVREALVYACEMRDPADHPTERKIRDFDDERIKAGRQRNAEHKFDIDAALKRAQASKPPAAAPPDLAQGGIFNPR